jgi:hypothetical protein
MHDNALLPHSPHRHCNSLRFLDNVPFCAPVSGDENASHRTLQGLCDLDMLGLFIASSTASNQPSSPKHSQYPYDVMNMEYHVSRCLHHLQ